MASLIRTAPWRQNPLGPPENWPQALKTTVDILLQSHQPAYVCWGRPLITLYNDAAIAVLGSRHPSALGRPYAEIFPESWHDLKPVIDAALAGEAQHIVGQRASRSGDTPASWNSYTWTPIHDDTGKIAGLYCVATEISLQIGGEQFKTVLENARDAVSMLDLVSNKYVFISPSHVALTGFTEDELKQFTPDDFRARLHPDDRARLAHPGRDTSTPLEGTAEYRWRIKSGEYRWFSVSRKIVRDANDQAVALVNVNRDITDRKHAELEIQASRATLDAALESMNDAVYITDAQGRFLRTNTRFATFHRFKSVEECAATFEAFAEQFDVFFPDCRPAPPNDRPVPRALRGEAAVGVEYSLVKKDTGESWIGSYSFSPIRDPDGTITGTVVTARDITERKRAEIEIGAARATLEAALSSLTDGICITDASGRIIHANRAFASYLRYDGNRPDTIDAIIDDIDMCHPDGSAVAYALRPVPNALAGGSGIGVEYMLRRKDSGETWIGSYSFGPIRDAYGTITGAVLTARDITTRKAAEAELKRSEVRYRLLHETQRDGFVQVAMDGRMLDCNDIYCEMVGYSRDELANLTYLDLTPERWRRIEDLIVKHEIIPRGYSDIYEKEYRRKDGSVVPVELRTILARDDNGNPSSMWALVRDLSEKRANEARMQSLKDQLVHVGRVNELSQVSAGIAHELNQPLAAMLNYSATAKRLIEKNDRAATEAAALAIARAGDQATRAGAIIRRMRDFVEKRDTNRKPDDINAIVKEAAELGLIGAKADGIETVFDLDPVLPPVTADRIQIEQVLVNLMHNAMDAMAGSATRRLTLATHRSGRAIEITVCDTGSGIPDSLGEKLFHPFVTTKTTGMGIGLAISRTIIEAHGGDISALSKNGETVFRFTLPVA
jgi:two-component system sensor kinase FixL